MHRLEVRAGLFSTSHFITVVVDSAMRDSKHSMNSGATYTLRTEKTEIAGFVRTAILSNRFRRKGECIVGCPGIAAGSKIDTRRSMSQISASRERRFSKLPLSVNRASGPRVHDRGESPSSRQSTHEPESEEDGNYISNNEIDRSPEEHETH